jgi:hypothetical protein
MRSRRANTRRAPKRLKDEESVFGSERVAGQIFDYLQGMINLGNATPFAVLITFDQAALVWAPSSES